MSTQEIDQNNSPRERNSPRGLSWDLIGKGIVELPKELTQPDTYFIQNITSLNIRDNKLKILPPDLTALTSLKYLNLSGNKWDSEKLNEVPWENWSNSLTTLDLGNCSLERLPSSIYQLQNMRSLLAHGNQLILLPEFNEGHLPNLEVLNMNYNKLQALPESIGYLTNLRQLYLFMNEMISLPLSFCKLTKLELVQLQNNPSFEGVVEDVRKALPKTKFSASVPDEVIPGKLFIGDSDVALNTSALKRKGITQILSVCEDSPDIDTTTFKHKTLSVDDVPTADISSHFDECHLFIEEGTTLVHCLAGISRSATVVISYLMHKLDKPLTEAITIVKRARPIIAPNDGFLAQLQTYERCLREQRCKDPNSLCS
jgi:hypothetical protein